MRKWVRKHAAQVALILPENRPEHDCDDYEDYDDASESGSTTGYDHGSFLMTEHDDKLLEEELEDAKASALKPIWCTSSNASAAAADFSSLLTTPPSQMELKRLPLHTTAPIPPKAPPRPRLAADASSGSSSSRCIDVAHEDVDAREAARKLLFLSCMQ